MKNSFKSYRDLEVWRKAMKPSRFLKSCWGTRQRFIGGVQPLHFDFNGICSRTGNSNPTKYRLGLYGKWNCLSIARWIRSHRKDVARTLEGDCPSEATSTI